MSSPAHQLHAHMRLRYTPAAKSRHGHTPAQWARQYAFTLIEVLVVLAILSILLTLAKPSFENMLSRYRVHAAAQAVEASFYLARSEAAKYRGKVIWQKAPNSACSGSAIAGRWECGWQIFVDANSNGQLDTDEHLVQTVPAQRGVQIARAPSINSQALNRWGRTGLGAAHYLIAPENDMAQTPPDYSRSMLLCISAGGRVRTLKGVAPPCA